MLRDSDRSTAAGAPDRSREPCWPWDLPPALPTSHYLDNRIYTDASILALEQRHIFRNTWKFVCHASEIARAAEFRLATVGDVPLVVVRGEDGRVRTFFNVCPHRGARLVREAHGVLGTRQMRCFYHHWSFRTDGTCLAIPRPEGYEGTPVRPENVTLREVRTAVVHGLVFVDIDGTAEPLDAFLGAALDEVATPLQDLEVFHHHAVTIKANWKLFVETNCEGYHELLHLLNRTTGLSQSDYASRKWVLHAGGHHTFLPANIAYERLRLEQRSANTLRGMAPNGHVVVDLFPDVMVNVRATVVRIDSLTPIAPGLTRLECRGLAPADDTPETREARIRQHNQVWGPLGRNLPEDIWAIETQWENMASGAAPYSIIAREQQQQAMDDAPIRSFYAEWRRRVGVAPHDVDVRDASHAGA